MRTVFVLLIVAVASFAAPVPKGDKPKIELVLSEPRTSEAILTLHNNSGQVVEWKVRTIRTELFEVEVRDKNGKVVPFDDPANLQCFPLPEDRVLSIPAGKSETIPMHFCHTFFPEDRPEGKLTVTVRLKLDGKKYVSNALTFKE